MGIYEDLAKLDEQSSTPEVADVQKRHRDKIAPKKKNRISNRGTTTPRHRDTTVSRDHGTITETVRKAVKEFGKEAATHRFTIEEKQAIADIIYSYKRQSIRTSENEITRIAVNFIIHDHRKSGGNSVLEKVLKALNG